MIIMSFLLVIGVIIAFVGPLAWSFAAVGKRISAEEKKEGRDLTNEINPFTGGR
jgi:hypothetical protein